MNPLIIILSLLFLTLCTLVVFLYFFGKKLERLEWNIISMFRSRTDTIPGIYEVSKEFLSKHEDIYKEALRLKKVEFSLLERSKTLHNILGTESLIHHEINFIFRVCNKHPKLIRNGNFIYMRDIVIKKSAWLWEMIALYKSMVKKYNSLLRIKNYSIIWIIFPLKKKVEI